MKRLSGKVAIDTGAGRGLGKAISEVFAAEGAQVAVLSRTRGNVESTVADIVAAGGQAAGFTCDVSNREEIDSAVKRVVEHFGGIDILVNNAHDTTGVTNHVLDITTEQLDRQFASGPFAALYFMQACQPHMLARGGGRVVNMASGAGVNGATNYGAYAMSKEALRALTRSAAREWGKDGITVNNVCPLGLTDALELAIERGFDAVPTTPIPRYGSPTKDIAPTVLFLASDEGQYLTGYTLMADGGLHIDTAR
jgi:NAD(P)-dependent dehydrogenase (short-subunit alcohol dehydrogenase family)